MTINFANFTPQELRRIIRNGQYNGVTSGLASGYLQANVLIIPSNLAYEFLLFCQKNPTSLPLIGVSQPGSRSLSDIGEDLDFVLDIPEYHIFNHGKFDKSVSNILNYWDSNFVTFLLGCSFSFEQALINSGLVIRNLQQGKNVSMYDTNIKCSPVGNLSGNVVVSMRPFSEKDAIRAIQITSRFPKAHGAPIHFGDPKKIGISNINYPDYGDFVDIYEDEIPVFWACGVTLHNIIKQSRLPFCITHAPGKMLVTDLLNDSLSIF